MKIGVLVLPQILLYLLHDRGPASRLRLEVDRDVDCVRIFGVAWEKPHPEEADEGHMSLRGRVAFQDVDNFVHDDRPIPFHSQSEELGCHHRYVLAGRGLVGHYLDGDGEVV